MRGTALGKRKTQIKVQSLGRFMTYILGYRPDEYGLVPDQDGFIPFKDLIKAIHEEPGWGYVRQGHIHEVLMGKERTRFETDEGKIRASERRWKMDLSRPCESPPKILFAATRRKAHAHVLSKGLASTPGRYIILTPDRAMALRIGTRQDQKPVLFEIMTSQARDKGTLFFPFEDLFLATRIPAACLSGPPLPKESERPAMPEKEKAPEARADPGAGTFPLDADRDPALYRRDYGKKRRGWKEDARKLRRRRGY